MTSRMIIIIILDPFVKAKKSPFVRASGLLIRFTAVSSIVGFPTTIGQQFSLEKEDDFISLVNFITLNFPRVLQKMFNAVLMVDHYPPCVNEVNRKKSEIIREKVATALKSLHLLPEQVLHEPIKKSRYLSDIDSCLSHWCIRVYPIHKLDPYIFTSMCVT